jgi:hypothetical protein
MMVRQSDRGKTTLPCELRGSQAHKRGVRTDSPEVPCQNRASKFFISDVDTIRQSGTTRRARMAIICRAPSEWRLVLGTNRVATEPTRWRHSGRIQVTVQYSPKRLSGFPELDLLATG